MKSSKNISVRIFNVLVFLLSFVAFALIFFPHQTIDYSALLSHQAPSVDSDVSDISVQVSEISDDMLFLDVRENEERNLGYIPDSIHVRLADLFAGEWRNLPRNKEIVIVCYGGSRALEAAEFLDMKGLDVKFLQGGLKEWKRSGRNFDGFLELNNYKNYKKIAYKLSHADVLDSLENGAVIVDAREERHYMWWHVLESISFPIYFSPTKELDLLFQSVPKGKNVILLCDGIARGCFSAIIAGLALEEKGYMVVGTISDIRNFKK